MLPSVCCLADARLVRLFPAVGRWGSPGFGGACGTCCRDEKATQPTTRLRGEKVASAQKSPRVFSHCKITTTEEMPSRKAREKSESLPAAPLTRWLGQKGRGILSQIVEPSRQLRFLPARESGTVGNPGGAARGNRRPSVPTPPDSCAKDGEKGLFSPKTGTVGSPRVQKPGRRYRRSRFPARPGAGFTDGPRFSRGKAARLPTVPDSRAARTSGADTRRASATRPPSARNRASPVPYVVSLRASAATGNWRARKC